MAELPTTYASLRLQVVDACVIALAERLDVREVAALDRRLPSPIWWAALAAAAAPNPAMAACPAIVLRGL